MAKENKDKKTTHYKRNLIEYFSFVKNHKWLFVSLIFLVIILEGLSLADKFLYKWLIDNAELFVSQNLTKDAFFQILYLVLIIFLGLIILKSIVKYATEKLMGDFEPKLIRDIREKYFWHIINLSNKSHTTHKTGSMISRLGRGAAASERLTDVFVYQIGPLFMQFVLVFISIAVFTWESALAIVLTSIVFISFSFYMQKKQEKYQIDFNKSEDREKGFVSDVFTNFESIKYYGKEGYINLKFKELVETTRIKLKIFFSSFSLIGAGQFFIMGVGTIFILYYPLMDFINKEITLGTVVLIYSLYGTVISGLYGFVHGIRNYYRAMTDFEELFSYGQIENEIKDKKNAKAIVIKEGSVEFKNVTFSYNDDRKKREIFKNLNLKIKPNEKVALVGHSGSGKSTIVKLLNRFYDVESGEILIDGINIKDVLQESIRSETGIVPQEAILFDDTIYNNIKFSNPQASKEEVMQAIKFAQLDKIIKNFPKKENTIVGERGIKLSGGEKQRVSIARAILANKRILVLDEATSALDSETEHEIQKDLINLLKGRTSIIIAHRLSTIMNADRIVVFKEGKIIEQGSHKELIKKRGGEYKKLWELQKGGFLEEKDD